MMSNKQYLGGHPIKTQPIAEASNAAISFCLMPTNAQVARAQATQIFRNMNTYLVSTSLKNHLLFLISVFVKIKNITK